MRNFIGDSIAGLLNDLKESINTFIREEVELAKKEMSEKVSTYLRNSVALVVGGSVAYAGLIVFLAGIGLIIGFGFEKLGVNSTLAVFAGLGITGVLASSIGALMVLQGIKAISATPPVPEKAIDAAKQVTGSNGMQTPKPQGIEHARSSDDLHRSAKGTAEKMGDDKEELLFQLTPSQLKARAVQHIKEHPLMWGAAVVGSAATVATGGVLFGRKLLMRGGIQAVKLLIHRFRT